MKAAKFDVRVVEAPGTLVNCVGRLAIRGRNFDFTSKRPYTTETGLEVTEEVKIGAYIIGNLHVDGGEDAEISFTDDEGAAWIFEVLDVIEEKEDE
jgi:hypothetical protein